jgi:hypothetical protein
MFSSAPAGAGIVAADFGTHGKENIRLILVIRNTWPTGHRRLNYRNSGIRMSVTELNSNFEEKRF